MKLGTLDIQGNTWLAPMAGVTDWAFRCVCQALGAAVTIANYLILTLSVDRAVRQFEEKRGKAEMTEEEAHAFTEENKKAVQLRIQLSFIVRALSLLGCLVLAFVSGQFEVIATLVPLVMMRPILMAEGYIRGRREAKEKTEAKD